MRKINSSNKGSILCFNGPPGVGKTSLVKSIAEALGRVYIRISLGGVRDESTIRGHRRTYLASMPGNIMQALKKSKTANPVILLDEIDKLGGENIKGDVESALLEVLDPEQNSRFNDHYLNTYFDISKVLFICTSNNIERISAPLRDRLEIIHISGYTLKEKIEISKKYLIYKQINQSGIGKFCNVIFPEDSIQFIIEGYTSESGVRGVEKKIESICRHIVKENVVNIEKTNKIIDENSIIDITINRDLIIKVLGTSQNKINIGDRTSLPGIAIGMAYTQHGGSIIFIEVSKSYNNSKSGKLEITGNIKQIMKESLFTSISWIKAYIHLIKPGFNVNEWDFHLHAPEASVPKDGPSAGITICSALVSSILDIKLRNDTAMTGELSLAGYVLPIGGLKEKILSAMSLGIKRFIIPTGNKKDIESKLSKEDQQSIKIIYVNQITQVLENILPYTKFDKTNGLVNKSNF